ncbi:hypothetical protein [Rhodococcus sp. G-MC3]|nr:hypothetical protein [Rhodococcus sp. G-MC3]
MKTFSSALRTMAPLGAVMELQCGTVDLAWTDFPSCCGGRRTSSIPTGD